MIYNLLKIIVKIALRLFYRKTSINGREKLLEHGPLIVVGNHPNTFMDPLIIATLMKQKVGFLGNASIFVHPFVNAIFRFFNVIPVYRDKDVPAGTKPDNAKTFRECYQYLEEKNTLMIFPEGTSYHELKLRKIKTGVSRISLAVEKKNNFELGLRVQPVGLYYSHPIKFRSDIYVNVGAPITVKDFEKTYLKEEVLGVQEMTKEVRRSLENLTISTEDKEQEQLFYKIKRIYKKHLVEKFGNLEKQNEEFRLTKEIAAAIQYFKISFPNQYSHLKAKIDRCNHLLDQVKAQGSSTKVIKSKLSKYALTISGFLYSLLGLPVFLFGIIQNYIPYISPYLIAKKLTKEPEYYAPIMMTLGILVFPLYYYLSTSFFGNYFDASGWLLLGYFALLPISGYYALHYSKFVRQGVSFIKLNGIFTKPNNIADELEALKNTLFEELDDARLAYLKRL